MSSNICSSTNFCCIQVQLAQVTIWCSQQLRELSFTRWRFDPVGCIPRKVSRIAIFDQFGLWLAVPFIFTQLSNGTFCFHFFMFLNYYYYYFAMITQNMTVFAVLFCWKQCLDQVFFVCSLFLAGFQALDH